jgi:omega-6 fatty acid desaturase (delta-12 desaturase)
VLVSLAAVAAFALIGLPTIAHFAGIGGVLKYWLMPWLGYHFWMSTFTVVHHTAPHIPFKPSEEWNAAKAQLSGTVDCEYPRWVEFLCHDISVHVPHHVNSKIPWYNLRAANESLKQNWGQYMTSCTFNWRMMKTIFTGGCLSWFVLTGRRDLGYSSFVVCILRMADGKAPCHSV